MLISPNCVITIPNAYAVNDELSKPFSWKKELQELFSSKFLNVIWWPVFKYKQQYFTHSPVFKFCKGLPGFGNLWNTIQKSSFAYNNLFLGIKPFHRSSSSTDLADVTTLTLFFGDAFIDGICEKAGKTCMRRLLNRHPDAFCFQKKVQCGFVQIEPHVDLMQLLPRSVMEDKNAKYQISYSEFYHLLQHFFQLINILLRCLPFEKAEKAADKIIDVCSTCIHSYLNDINSYPVGENIRDVATVLDLHELKTRYMQEKLLELRCILSNKEHMMQSSQANGWMDIMRVVQIYDDLQDVHEDDDFQDNLVISVAFHYFPGEWSWFRMNKKRLQEAHHNSILLSFYMPQTVQFCLKLAAAKIIPMNWEQQKIIHYLLFKNWFLECEDEEIKHLPGISTNNFSLKTLLWRLQSLMPETDEKTIKAYIVDTCFHLKKGRKIIRKKIGWNKYYQLRYNLLTVSTEKKSKFFDTISRQFDKSVHSE